MCEWMSGRRVEITKTQIANEQIGHDRGNCLSAFACAPHEGQKQNYFNSTTLLRNNEDRKSKKLRTLPRQFGEH